MVLVAVFQDWYKKHNLNKLLKAFVLMAKAFLKGEVAQLVEL